VHTGSLKELPPRFEKQELREYAQMDERYLLARATQQVSVLTKGILAMEATLLGIVEADPKKLLEDGIRKELVKRISVALHNTLVFPQQGKPGELEGRLDALQRHLEGFRRSFEYISDYVNIYGLKIWQEEFGRIVNFSVEQECNAYLKKKIYPWQSHFQSKAIPIPVYPPLDEYCNNFIGRLVREVLSLTDVQASVYLDANSGWFEASTGKELLGIRTCSMLHKSVGTAGVRGIDTTLAFLIVSQIQKFVKFHRGEVLSNLGQVLEELTVELGHPSTLPAQASKLYAAAKARTAKAWPGVMQIVGRVGQAQLLRRHLASQLNFSCRLDSPNLSGALQVVSDSLTNDICAHYQHPDKYPYPKEESGLLGDIAPYLDTFGLTSPVLKIYITTEPLPHIAMAMFVFCIASLQKYAYDTKLQILAPRDRRDACDATPFVVGVITLLKQFHSSDTHHFIQLLCQHLRCLIVMQGKDSPKKKEVDLGGEAVNLIVFLQEFCKFSSLDRKAVQDHLPPYVFDKYPV
jgi:WASH complex subunit strumpellin